MLYRSRRLSNAAPEIYGNAQDLWFVRKSSHAFWTLLSPPPSLPHEFPAHGCLVGFAVHFGILRSLGVLIVLLFCGTSPCFFVASENFAREVSNEPLDDWLGAVTRRRHWFSGRTQCRRWTSRPTCLWTVLSPPTYSRTPAKLWRAFSASLSRYVHCRVHYEVLFCEKLSSACVCCVVRSSRLPGSGLSSKLVSSAYSLFFETFYRSRQFIVLSSFIWDIFLKVVTMFYRSSHHALLTVLHLREALLRHKWKLYRNWVRKP